MTLELLLAGALPSLAVMLIGWIFTRAVKQSDKVHALDIRLTKAEEKLHGHAGRLTGTELAMKEISENMVRRDDFDRGLEALGQRIDDALRK